NQASGWIFKRHAEVAQTPANIAKRLIDVAVFLYPNVAERRRIAEVAAKENRKNVRGEPAAGGNGERYPTFVRRLVLCTLHHLERRLCKFTQLTPLRQDGNDSFVLGGPDQQVPIPKKAIAHLSHI